VSEESKPLAKLAEVPQKAEEPGKVEEPAAAASEAAVVMDPTPEVTASLQQWATAWSNKGFEAYAGFYSDAFRTPKFRSKAAWLKYREPRVMGNEDIQVTIEDVFVGKINVAFIQRYSSKALKIRSVKKMVMENTANGWKILFERD